jgi:hypothetical protein
MKLKKEVMNKIIASMAKNQNKKSKMNAGELREAAALFVKAMFELSAEDKTQAIKGMIK